MPIASNVTRSYQTVEYGKFVEFSEDSNFPPVSVVRWSFPDTTSAFPGNSAAKPLSSVDVYPKYGVISYIANPGDINAETFKTRNVYDNFDNLKSIIVYDKNNKVDHVLKNSVNNSGKEIETRRLQQVQLVAGTPENITSSSATLYGVVTKNDNNKVYETGFIVWAGDDFTSVIGKTQYGNTITPTVFKGSFSKAILNLADNTEFNYRAYAKHDYGINYSEVYKFTTLNSGDIFTAISDKSSGPVPLTVSLSAINAGTGVSSYAWNLTGGQTPQFTTQVVSYTYLNAGTFTARASAIMDNGDVKVATKEIIATGITSYTDQWNNVLSGSYGNNIVGAYDFRDTRNISLARDLVAFWKLDNLTDSSGNGNTLTNNGDAQFVTGKIGNCAITDGSNYLQNNSLSPTFNPNGPEGEFTISCWVNPNTLGNYYQAFLGSGSYGFIIHIDTSGNLYCNEGASGDAQINSIIQTDQWQHIVFVKSIASGYRTKVWYNGTKVYDEETGSRGNYGSRTDITLGNYGTTDFPYDGKLDMVGLWLTAVTVVVVLVESSRVVT
jgi:hypothetical protein